MTDGNTRRWRLKSGDIEILGNGWSVSDLRIGDETILRHWGIEMGERGGTWSVQNKVQTARLKDVSIDQPRPDTLIFSARVQTTEIDILVTERIRLVGRRIFRLLRFDTQTPSLVFDLVARFGFDGATIEHVSIGDEALEFAKPNTYHQRAANTASLKTRAGNGLRFSWRVAGIPDGYGLRFYWRNSTVAEDGSTPAWIGHLRIIAEQPTTWWVLGCHRIWSRLITGPFSWPFLIPPLRGWLHNIRERSIPRFPLQVMGGRILAPGDSPVLGIVIRVEPPVSALSETVSEAPHEVQNVREPGG